MSKRDVSKRDVSKRDVSKQDVSKRDAFLLRLDEKVLAAIRRWADDDLRSVNGQIEYLLRSALVESGRLPKRPDDRTDHDARKGAS